VLRFARHVAECEECREIWRNALAGIQQRKARHEDVEHQMDVLYLVGYPPTPCNVIPLLVRGLMRVVRGQPPADSSVKRGVLRLLQACLEGKDSRSVPAWLALEAVRKLQSDADPTVRESANVVSLVELDGSENVC